SIVWILLIATVRAWRLDTSSKAPYVVFGLVIVLILALAWMWDSAAQQRAARYAPSEPGTEAAEGGPGQAVTGSAYPVPPLDLPHYHGVGLDAGPGITTVASDTDASAKEVTGA
ncbi:MAG: hypothetical protein WAK82_06560, partial [Streptosporangiaceae bacterium]